MPDPSFRGLLGERKPQQPKCLYSLSPVNVPHLPPTPSQVPALLTLPVHCWWHLPNHLLMATFLFFGAGEGTQGLEHTKHTLYYGVTPHPHTASYLQCEQFILCLSVRSAESVRICLSFYKILVSVEKPGLPLPAQLAPGPDSMGHAVL